MAASKKTLVILDAHAIIHRAYHALPSFVNSQGVPTGALYGLSTMIMKMVEDLKPDYVVAAYDLPKPTFRHHAFKEYKGTRAKTDDDLVAQLKTSRELFAAFGIPCLDAEGFEADDVIGTLVEQFKKQKELSIIIASGDMDTLQLVDGKKVQVYTLKKGVGDTILYDEDAVRARYGFDPVQLVDYKGLRGDPSDNISGVRGIGEKTATAIIETFGTIEGLYEAIEQDPQAGKRAGLTPRITTLLLEHKDDAFFSKTLATIRRDAPVSYAIPQQTFVEGVDAERVRTLFAAYEFSSLVPRVKKVFKFEDDAPKEEIDPLLLREASIALWVLYSEQTAPTYEMILERTRKDTLKEAYEVVVAELKKRNLYEVFDKIERPIIGIVSAMEQHGILIDVPYFEQVAVQMKEKLAGIEALIIAECGVSINLNSPKQLSELLFGTLGLKPKGKKKASGAYTTNAETLESLVDEHPIVPRILEYRETQKLLSTYVQALLEHKAADGRVHATFLQHGTTTGRFSSNDPNLQNLPMKASGKDIRHGFVAAPGHVFVGSDYSQIELRMLAMLSGDQKLIDSFSQGNDIHATVASFMFGVPLAEVTGDQRRAAKVVNFGILYGMGVSALQKNLGTTREKAAQFYTEYFDAFPDIAAYLERTKEHAKTHGYTETMFGRRRYFPNINAGAPFLRAFAERMATNAPIQGSNADVVKIAIALIDADIRAAGIADRVHLVLQVHDELIYEVAETVQEQATHIIKQAMESVFERSPIKVTLPIVPLAVGMGSGHRLDELK